MLFCSFGFLGHLNQGYEFRSSPEIQEIQKRLYNGEIQFQVDSLSKADFSNDERKKILIIGDSFAKDFLEGLVTLFGKEINNFDIMMRSVSRRCKNVLENTNNINDYLFKTDAHCFDKRQRIGNSDWEPLIEASDLIIVRSNWDVLPTMEMPRTYDYLNSINNKRVIFIGAQFFGRHNPFNNLKSLNNITSNMYAYDIAEIQPYSKVNKAISSYDLIIKAKDLMGERNYFDVFHYFCLKNKCLITNEDGYPLTNDMEHLTVDGESIMLKSLFKDARFKEIWHRTIGVYPPVN